MEDTKSLLMMVLHQIFQYQPKIVENTFQLIHNYNSGKIGTSAYDEILKLIYDLMKDKLPLGILVYLLTLVNMPEEWDSQSSIVEKMRTTRDCLPEINARPLLLKYLNDIKPNLYTRLGTISPKLTTKRKRADLESSSFSEQTSSEDEDYPNNPKVLKNTNPFEAKRLSEICLDYVVNNKDFLSEMYANEERKLRLLFDNFEPNELEIIMKKIDLLKAIKSNKFDSFTLNFSKRSKVSLNNKNSDDDDSCALLEEKDKEEEKFLDNDNEI